MHHVNCDGASEARSRRSRRGVRRVHQEHLPGAVDAATNLDQVGDIVCHGIAHPAVRGVVFQPVTRAGRMPTFDPLARLINPERACWSAGFRIDHVERHDEALAATVDVVTSRLRALRLLDLPLLRTVDIRRAIDVARRVADVVDRGDAGYFALTATKGPLR